MRPVFVTLESFTHRPRNEAIAAVLAVLGAQGGSITGTEALGGLALMLRIEMPTDTARTLATRLEHAGIRLDPDSRRSLASAVAAASDLEGSLLLRFLADEPDVKITVPKVPG